MSFLKFQNDIHLQNALSGIDERLKELEKRVLKTARKDTTHRIQQMLLLQQLGMLEKLDELKMSRNKKAKLLSVLINASEHNIKGDLTNIRKEFSILTTEDNLKVLIKAYNDSALKDLAEKTDKQLKEVMKRESKKK